MRSHFNFLFEDYNRKHSQDGAVSQSGVEGSGPDTHPGLSRTEGARDGRANASNREMTGPVAASKKSHTGGKVLRDIRPGTSMPGSFPVELTPIHRQHKAPKETRSRQWTPLTRFEYVWYPFPHSTPTLTC